MKISIIIPNYNGEKLLRDNLPKVINGAMKQCNNGIIEIIIVDDASTDNSVEEVRSQKSEVRDIKQRVKIRLIKNEKNLGFSSTVNRGVREAEGDLVFLLNSDAVPQKNFLDPLLPHFKNSKVFAVGCLQESVGWKGEIKHGRGVGKFEKGFLVHGPGSLDKKNTLWVFGGAGVFRKSIWEKLGGMDTLYNPFYWEDIDLSYRALKAGFKLIFEPKSVVFHNHEEGAIKSSYDQSYIESIAYRNQILFVWLNITSIIFLSEHFIYLPYHLFKAVITQDVEFIRGFFMAVQKLPNVVSHRRRNSKLGRVSDEEVLKEKNNND